MKVKITKCSGKGYWYKDCIGGVFIVNEIDRLNGGYWVAEDNNIGWRYIDAVDCEIIQKEMQMIQLTEEDARTLLLNSNASVEVTLKTWKQKGWIKKTALEEAREFVKNIDKGFSHYEQDAVRKCAELYEQAIKEVQEKE